VPKAFTNLRLDHSGIGEVLASGAMRGAVTGQAEAIASAARSGVAASAQHGVVVDSYSATLRRDVRPRAAASVTIRDVRGRAWQALHGVLSGPARALGMDVRLRP
jgi:hypothetical protein